LFVRKVNRDAIARRPNPFDGLPGWWNRVNRALYPVMGPSNIGAGGPERPVVDTANAPCPICGVSLALHTFERSTDGHTSTRMYCP
jgi:hypothetical protein